ncbi:MAG TPA: hypothetical protein VLB73_02060 [Patescibacteria group bacterium]|nr:hypothetical protein [Patescibacteria group bacterium]
MTRLRERVHESIENTRALTGAAWGAATRDAVLHSHIDSYLEKIRREAPSFDNPTESIIQEALAAKIIQVTSHASRDSLLTNPWNSRRIKPSRLAASLIAFSNDHGKKTVPEFFPVEEILVYLNSIQEQAKKTGKQLTVIDQFNLALDQTNNNPVAAALLAHSSYRAIARSCDTRLSPQLAFEVDSSTQPITMMSVAQSTADFSVNDQRDPLGNTYHWWSQFSAGMIFALLKKDNPIQVATYNTAFSAGPELTVLLRQKIRRRQLAAGDHKQVDRQGKRIGRAMGAILLHESQQEASPSERGRVRVAQI